MRRDAEDRRKAATESETPGPRSRKRASPPPAPARGTRARKKRTEPATTAKPRAKAKRPRDPLASPTEARIELVTERQGVLGYRYRRLTITQEGRQAQVREARLQLDYDLQFHLATRPRDLARVRGCRLSAAEWRSLWSAVTKRSPLRLEDRYELLDSVVPEQVDDTVGADGEPIAVSTGEEGPACLTITWRDPSGETRRKRILIDRFREPEVAATQPAAARKAPLAALCALIDAKLKAKRTLSSKRVEVLPLIAEELAGLRPRDFLNLRQVEGKLVEALGATAQPGALPLLEPALFAPDGRVRLQALDAIRAIRDPAAIPTVSDLIYDDDTAVRDRARKLVAFLADPTAPAAESAAADAPDEPEEATPAGEGEGPRSDDSEP